MRYIIAVFVLLLLAGTAGYKYFTAEKQAEDVKHQKYVKINIAELYMILNDDKLSPMHDMDYVFRGRIYLDSGLKKEGNFGVLRVAMVCCAADTVAVGFKIPLRYLNDGFNNGDWVQVKGRAHRINSDKEGETLLRDKTSKTMSGSPVEVSVRNDFIFLPDEIEKIERPDDGYIYKWKTQPPYNY